MPTKRHMLLMASACLACGAANAQTPNTLTPQEKAQGWHLLFNGSNLDGWHSYLQKAPGRDWSVHDGSIELQRGRNGRPEDFADLVTAGEYANFDLKLEWRMTPCADSGVMFYVNESPKYAQPYETGPEMQIADLACTKPDSRVLNERSGDLFDLISSPVEWVDQAPQWNRFEIIADHGHLQFFQNGHKVIDTWLWTDDWKKLVASTKFKAWPDFGTFQKGHISLQGTEDKGETPIRLQFRDIKLREL